ncbi:MAG: hypothetical protein MUF45_01910, partial [Spirosomaceae bacterium]|nr:hypothetical protein [Spirosomataceae bacterium]
MKVKLVWVLFSVLLSKEVYPQIKIISSNTKEAIPFAEIYNNDSGGFIGFSDENGFIQNTLLDKIQKSEVASISFNHLGFKRRSVAKNELINSKTIELEESSIILDGV